MADASAPPSFIKTLLSGGGGGASLVIVGQPLDTIKVRLQTMEIVAGKKPMYSGMIDCGAKMVSREGPLALYKGITAPLAATTPMYALCFFGYGVGKQIFTDKDAYDPKNLKLGQIGCAGATSALFTTPIQAPQERLKCVLQTSTDKSLKGPIDVAKHLYAEAGGGLAGFRSLTRGFGVTMVRDASASVMYFSFYELMKVALCEVPGLSADGKVNFGGVLVAGGVAGVMNWCPAIPFDVCKTRLQVAPEGKYSGAIFGSTSVLKEVWAEGGLKALYRGTLPIFVRAVPANAACFCGFEVCMDALTKAGMP